MSGGSYDYVYSRFQDAASTLRDKHPEHLDVLALASLLDRIAETMRAIEWADSCDTSWDDELDAAIAAIVRDSTDAALTARAAAAERKLAEVASLAAYLTPAPRGADEPKETQ